METGIDTLTRDDIASRVTEIIAEQAFLEPGDVTPSSTLQDLGIDSLGLVEAVFAFEESFEISIPFNANEPQSSDFDISSVQSIVDAIASLVSQKA